MGRVLGITWAVFILVDAFSLGESSFLNGPRVEVSDNKYEASSPVLIEDVKVDNEKDESKIIEDFNIERDSKKT